MAKKQRPRKQEMRLPDVGRKADGRKVQTIVGNIEKQLGLQVPDDIKTMEIVVDGE